MCESFKPEALWSWQIYYVANLTNITQLQFLNSWLLHIAKFQKIWTSQICKKKFLSQFKIYALPCFVIKSPGPISSIVPPQFKKKNKKLLWQFKINPLSSFSIITPDTISNISSNQFCNKNLSQIIASNQFSNKTYRNFPTALTWHFICSNPSLNISFNYHFYSHFGPAFFYDRI